MSSTAYATPLRLELKPSRTLFWLLTFSHLGAAGLMPTMSLPIWASAFLGLSVAASYLWLMASHALKRHPGAVVSLLWPSGIQWQVRSRNGQEVSAQLSPESFVRPWLTVLLLRPETGGRARNVVLLPDMVDAEAFRRLRVRLRLEYKAGKSAPAEKAGKSLTLS